MEKLNLNNLLICDQNWDTMPESERGRICQKCQTEIIDFRKMSDLEIAYEHSVGAGRVCGIYRDENVDKNMPFDYPKTFLVAIFGCMIASTSLHGQMTYSEPIIQLDKLDAKIHDSEFQIIKEKKLPLIVYGKLLDTHRNPIEGVSVFVLNSRNGTITDKGGRFSLVLDPELLEKEKFELVFSLIGAGRIVQSFSVKDMLLNNHIDVENLESVRVLEYRVPVIERSSFRQGSLGNSSRKIESGLYTGNKLKRIWGKIKRVLRKEK